MKKQLMLLASLTLLCSPLATFAEKHMDMTVEQNIKIHEELIKVNQDAITCLKSGKPQMECGKAFKEELQKMRSAHKK